MTGKPTGRSHHWVDPTYAYGCDVIDRTVIVFAPGPYCQKIRHADGVLFSTYESKTSDPSMPFIDEYLCEE